MTDPRVQNCEASANVIALVNAQHHGYDLQAAHAYTTMDPDETRRTLVAAIDELSAAWEVDAIEQGMTWDDYVSGISRSLTA